jgi:hypothetical protein
LGVQAYGHLVRAVNKQYKLDDDDALSMCHVAQFLKNPKIIYKELLLVVLLFDRLFCFYFPPFIYLFIWVVV